MVHFRLFGASSSHFSHVADGGSRDDSGFGQRGLRSSSDDHGDADGRAPSAFGDFFDSDLGSFDSAVGDGFSGSYGLGSNPKRNGDRSDEFGRSFDLFVGGEFLKFFQGFRKGRKEFLGILGSQARNEFFHVSFDDLARLWFERIDGERSEEFSGHFGDSGDAFVGAFGGSGESADRVTDGRDLFSSDGIERRIRPAYVLEFGFGKLLETLGNRSDFFSLRRRDVFPGEFGGEFGVELSRVLCRPFDDAGIRGLSGFVGSGLLSDPIADSLDNAGIGGLRLVRFANAVFQLENEKIVTADSEVPFVSGFLLAVRAFGASFEVFGSLVRQREKSKGGRGFRSFPYFAIFAFRSQKTAPLRRDGPFFQAA
jgi:hypothetical protein